MTTTLIVAIFILGYAAITLEHSYELSEYTREALIYTKDILLEPAPKQPPLRPNVPGAPTPAGDA